MDSRARAASANLCYSNGDGTARSSRSHRRPQTSRSLSTTISGIWLDGYTVRRIECPPEEIIGDANPKLDEKGRLRFRRKRPDLQSSLGTGNQSPLTRTLSKHTQHLASTMKLAPPKIPAFFEVSLGSSEVGRMKNQDVCHLELLSTAGGTVPVALVRACLEQVTLLCPKWSTLSLEQRQRFAVNEQLAWLQRGVNYVSTKFKCAEDVFDLDCSSLNADGEIGTLDRFIYYLFQHLQKLGCRFSECTNSVLYRTTLLCLQTILHCALERLKHIHQRSTERPLSPLIRQSVGLAKVDSTCSPMRNEQRADVLMFDPTITDPYLPTVPAELVSVKISSTQHINSDETELKSTNPASSNPLTSIPQIDPGTQTSWIPSFSITSEEKRLELSTLDPHASLMTSSSIPVLCGPAEHMRRTQNVDSIDKMTKPWEENECCTSVELLFTTANMRPSLIDRSDRTASEDRPNSEQSSRICATQRSSSIPRSLNRNAYYCLTFVPPNSNYSSDGMQESADLLALQVCSPTDPSYETQSVAFTQKTEAAQVINTYGDKELGSTTDKENQLHHTNSMTVHKQLVERILALMHKGLRVHGKTVTPLVRLSEDQKICHQVENLLDHTMAISLTKRINELCEGTSSMQLSQIVTSAPINIELLMAKKLLEIIPDVNFFYSTETILEGPGEARVFNLAYQIAQTITVNQTRGNSPDVVASSVAKILSRGLLGLAYSASCYAMDHLLETKVDTELRTCTMQQDSKCGLEGSRPTNSSTFLESQPTTMQTVITSNVSPAQCPLNVPNSTVTVQHGSHLPEEIRPSTAMKEQEISKKEKEVDSNYSIIPYCTRSLNSQELEPRVAETINPQNNFLSPTKFHLPAEEQRCVVVSCTDRNCFSPQPLTQHGVHSPERNAQHLLSVQSSPSEYVSNDENDTRNSLSSTYTEPQGRASMKEVTVEKDNMCVHMTFSVPDLKDTKQCVLRPLTIKTGSDKSQKETYTRLTSNDKDGIVLCKACSKQLGPYLYRQLEDGASVDNPFGIEVGIQCDRSRSRQNRSRSSMNRSAGRSSRFNLTAISMDDPGRMDPPTLSACVSAIHVSLNEDNDNDDRLSTDGSGRSSDKDGTHFMMNRRVRHRGFRTDEVTSTSSVIYRSVSMSVQEIQGNQDGVARELRAYPHWLTDNLTRIDNSEDARERGRSLTRGAAVPFTSRPRPKGDTLLQEKSLRSKQKTGQKTKLYWQSRKEQTANRRGDGGCKHSGRSRLNCSAEYTSYPEDDFSVPGQNLVGQKKPADPTEPFYSCLQELKKCLREAESRLKTVQNYSGQSIKITRTRPRIVPRQTTKKLVGIEARQKTHRGKPGRLKQWPTLPEDTYYDASALGGGSIGGESTTCDRLPTCSERTAPTSSRKQASIMKTAQKEDVPSARQLRKSCFRSYLNSSTGPPSTARWTVDDIRSRGPKFFPAPSMELPVRGTSNESRIPLGTQMSNCLLYVKHQGNKPLSGPLVSGQHTPHNSLSRSSFGQTSNMAVQNTSRLCKKVAHRME
ncbi:hypothetical protein CRM22_010690 [Opisthorchis felineus]|uniref:Uncharacterized protein n=1 Tax=Opisthorchis felineus TaxID=147828 RepID=A0A4V3SBA3_OPIFE|nr:hypothetical protein CRM22_010690 [Opisthorchis felineus]